MERGGLTVRHDNRGSQGLDEADRKWVWFSTQLQVPLFLSRQTTKQKQLPEGSQRALITLVIQASLQRLVPLLE